MSSRAVEKGQVILTNQKGPAEKEKEPIMSFIMSCTFSASNGDECSQFRSLAKILTLSLSNLLVQNLKAQKPFGSESHRSKLLTRQGFRECEEKMCHHECRSRTHLAVAREQTLLYGCKVVLEGLKFYTIPNARIINKIFS